MAGILFVNRMPALLPNEKVILTNTESALSSLHLSVKRLEKHLFLILKQPDNLFHLCFFYVCGPRALCDFLLTKFFILRLAF